MPLRRYKDRVEVSVTKLLARATFSMILCVGSAVCVRAQDAQANKTEEPWTATTQTSIDHANPSRTAGDSKNKIHRALRSQWHAADENHTNPRR